MSDLYHHWRSWAVRMPTGRRSQYRPSRVRRNAYRASR